MHLLTTKLGHRKGLSEGLVSNASAQTKDAATNSAMPIDGFIQRGLMKSVVALKNLFRQSKVHYYHISDRGSSFFLEDSTEFADEVYITSCQALVEPSDLIKIEYVSATTTYRIVELQNYSNSPEIWVARLKALPSDG